jgi:hypothetical protein
MSRNPVHGLTKAVILYYAEEIEKYLDIYSLALLILWD